MLLLCSSATSLANLRAHDVLVMDAVSTPVDSNGEPLPIALHLSAMGQDILLQLQPSRLNRVGKLDGMQNADLPYLYEGRVEGDINSWARISVKDGEPSGHIFHYGKLLQLDNRQHLRGLIDDTVDGSSLVLIEPASSSHAAPMLRSFGLSADEERFAPTYRLSDDPAFHQATQAFNPNTGQALFRSELKTVSVDAVDTGLSKFNSTASKSSRFINKFSTSKKVGTRNKTNNAITNRNTIGKQVTRAMRVGIVVDSSFNETHQSRGLARALSIMNSVDAIYQSQLGVAIIVEGIRVYDNPNTDPMRAKNGTVNQILSNFKPIRQADERLPADLTLVHLFTGHRDPDRVIGLGWISTACRLDGFDLSMSTPFPFDALLAAHEIAHNLGALHDDNEQCLTEVDEQSNTLMWPELSSSSTAAFSHCSARNMQASLNASCNLNNIDVGVRLRTYPSSEFLRRSVVIDVANQDLLQRSTEVISSTKFPFGTLIHDISAGCSVNSYTVTCNHGTLQAQTIHSMSMSATLLDRSSESVQTQLELLNATDVTANDNRAVINLLTFDKSTGEAVAAESEPFADDIAYQQNDTVGGIGSASAMSIMGLLLFIIRACGLRRWRWRWRWRWR